MSTRSVRLDDEAENALREIVERTGISISDAVKCGLLEYRAKTLSAIDKKPSDFFEEFDLGEDNYAIGAARESKHLIKERIAAKQRG